MKLFCIIPWGCYISDIKKIIIVVLLFAACRNSPSSVAGDGSDTGQSSRKAIVQGAGHIADSAVSAHRSSPAPARLREFILDLNGDDKPDTIALTPVATDTSIFTSVAIVINGYERKTFSVADTARPWTDFDYQFADSNSNAVHTRCFFLRKGRTNAVLLLFGLIDETSDREGFTVIKIEHNQARQVLDQNTQHLDLENILFLRDLDNDGRFDLICGHTIEFNGMTDSLGGLVGPYNPFYVYTIDDTCFLNKRLMREYNQKNYVFAGYQYSDSTKVFYPDDRSLKPRLWKP